VKVFCPICVYRRRIIFQYSQEVFCALQALL
jgi:hypothetical protein